jgi:hypothetical protein
MDGVLRAGRSIAFIAVVAVSSSLSAMDEPYEIVSNGQPTGLVELSIDWTLTETARRSPDTSSRRTTQNEPARRRSAKASPELRAERT